MPTERNQMIIYVGAVLVILGAFAPLTSLPVVGDISYYDLSNPDVFFVILFAAAGPALVFLKKEMFVLASAAGVWLTLLWPVIRGAGGGSDDGGGGLLGKITDKAADPMKEFAADFFTNIFEFSWGGWVFLIGLLALTAGCVMTFLVARKAG